MKQKVGLCGALVHDPDLLILDEPTTGVDPLSRRQFWTLIDDIRAGRPGMSVVISTAYMDEAQQLGLDRGDGRRAGAGDRHAGGADAAHGHAAISSTASSQLLPEEKRKGHTELRHPAAPGGQAGDRDRGARPDACASARSPRSIT